jgi:hypothetical protein
MSTNVSSLGKVGWQMAANLASPTNFPKRPFWRVLEFDKFAVEWPLLIISPSSMTVKCFATGTDSCSKQFLAFKLL